MFHHKAMNEDVQRRWQAKIVKRTQREEHRGAGGPPVGAMFLTPVPLYYTPVPVKCAAYVGQRVMCTHCTCSQRIPGGAQELCAAHGLIAYTECECLCLASASAHRAQATAVPDRLHGAPPASPTRSMCIPHHNLEHRSLCGSVESPATSTALSKAIGSLGKQHTSHSRAEEERVGAAEEYPAGSRFATIS
ncbi:hypothetical protein B0H17DRAFT_1136190 [Mycena rosella]|uniref:Uncharacterized protein n=1 Tax=Mycena rosella TaxID=1033263 RepID=A0AAD7DBC2_MYCRO|nr:hypothetical protein B0H17DRAFT_1136190 [Mycena rosella]